jgi:hypothetical protein
MRSLGSLLGAYWTREQVEGLFVTDQPGRQRKPLQELITPVTMMLSEGQMTDWLKKQFGASMGMTSPEWLKHHRGEVVEGYAMDRDDFIRMAGIFTPLIPRGR